ncbi:MAG: hypothetical protein HFK09_03655 [Clostridia bacterium]|nr:hypothetical protein [Clostridia bacterium]
MSLFLRNYICDERGKKRVRRLTDNPISPLTDNPLSLLRRQLPLLRGAVFIRLYSSVNPFDFVSAGCHLP